MIITAYREAGQHAKDLPGDLFCRCLLKKDTAQVPTFITGYSTTNFPL